MLSRFSSVGRLIFASGKGVEPDLKRHLPALDAVRGLAILAVLVYRFAGGSPFPASLGNGVLPWLHVGSRGVDLFFVLSGFLITGILYDARGREQYFTRFYWRRTLRIFPLYYAVLFAALIVSPALLGTVSWNEQAVERSPWLWCYGTNILQAATGQWCFGWFDHFWSLAVEEHFYLAWPVAIWLLRRQAAMRVCLAVGLLSVGGRVAWLAAGGNPTAAEVFTLFRLDGLLAGAWLALAAREGQGLVRFVPAAKIVFLCTSVLLAPVTLLRLRLLAVVDTLWAIEFASFLVLILTAAPASRLCGVGECRTLHWFGKYSYGMYVFANLLIPLLAGAVTAPGLAEFTGSPVLGQASYLVIMTAATSGAAVLSWHLFESHFVRLKALGESRPCVGQAQAQGISGAIR